MSKYNREWLVNNGPFTLLQSPSQGDTSLQKPYQFFLPFGKFHRLEELLKKEIGNYAQDLQCDLVRSKRTRYGFRLTVFLLGFSPGFIGGSGGITKKRWNGVTEEVTEIFTTRLGKGVKPYHEPWNETAKFQYRAEVYVQTERIPQSKSRVPTKRKKRSE